MSDKPAAAPMTAERMQAMLDGSPFIRFCGMRVAAIDHAAACEALVALPGVAVRIDKRRRRARVDPDRFGRGIAIGGHG